jgi:hypothetical protein
MSVDVPLPPFSTYHRDTGGNFWGRGHMVQTRLIFGIRSIAALAVLLLAEPLLGSGWVPTRVVSISYPLLAQHARISGEVVAEVVVAPDGTTSAVEILSGHPLLVYGVAECLRSWRFRKLEPDDANGVH